MLPTTILAPAAALLAYVAGLTYTARQESLDKVSNLWPLPLLAAPVVVALAGSDYSPVAIVALIALAAVGLRVGQLLLRRSAGDVSRAVGLLIAAIALNDALFATTTGRPMHPSPVLPASPSLSSCNASSKQAERATVDGPVMKRR